MKTTRQIFTEANVAKPTAIRWAEKNGVKKWGRDYTWSLADEKRFKNRNKKRGNPNWGKK